MATNFSFLLRAALPGASALFLSATLLQGSPAAAQGPRERLLMDFGWKFTLGDPADAVTAGGTSIFAYPELGVLDKTLVADRVDRAAADAARPDPVSLNLGGELSYVKSSYNDQAWRSLNLPHDWVVELPFGPGDCSGADVAHGQKAVDSKKGSNIGWYRRTFELAEADKGKALWLEFDGVYRNSLVWLNGHCLGRHNSGYSSFALDISTCANFGGKNTVVIRADATRGEGWFYEGAGIYRHVWLVKTAPLHVAHWGTYVTNSLQGADADVSVQTSVQNDATTTVSAQLISTIQDAKGKVVAKTAPTPVVLAGGAKQSLVQRLQVKNAKLWSLEQPVLYRVVSTIQTNGQVADCYETPFGIRTIRFDPERGFLLNGQRVQIKGTCNHQDHAGVGSALPDRLQYFRLEKLKEMGCNAIRTSHNPPTPELLEACDRLGMLVMDENRRFDDTPEVLGQLERLIRRDHNHPSIVIWSLANEEFKMQPNEQEGVQIARTMQDLAHRLDPTRPVTLANNGEPKAWRKGYNNLIEVAGCNYFSLEEKNLDQFHADFPNRLVIGTEEASTVCTRGEYANNTNAAFLPAYDVTAPAWGATAEQWWSFYAARSWLPGAFVWTGFDYRGEPTPFKSAYSSQFGVMDTCGFPKDNFYYYQAWWTDKTVLHLLPHWNWPGKEGQQISVWAHSNCEEVELFLNGRSLGRQLMKPNSHLEWKVTYAPGILLARGYKHGKQIAESRVETTGAPAALRLTPDRATIHADGEDVVVVTVAVVDAQGRIVPVANNEVHFDLGGPCRIIGVGNGHPNTVESDKLPQRHLFNGLAQVIVQAEKTSGKLKLTATSPGLQTATVTIKSATCPLRPCVGSAE